MNPTKYFWWTIPYEQYRFQFKNYHFAVAIVLYGVQIKCVLMETPTSYMLFEFESYIINILFTIVFICKNKTVFEEDILLPQLPKEAMP